MDGRDEGDESKGDETGEGDKEEDDRVRLDGRLRTAFHMSSFVNGTSGHQTLIIFMIVIIIFMIIIIIFIVLIVFIIAIVMATVYNMAATRVKRSGSVKEVGYFRALCSGNDDIESEEDAALVVTNDQGFYEVERLVEKRTRKVIHTDFNSIRSMPSA